MTIADLIAYHREEAQRTEETALAGLSSLAVWRQEEAQWHREAADLLEQQGGILRSVRHVLRGWRGTFDQKPKSETLGMRGLIDKD